MDKLDRFNRLKSLFRDLFQLDVADLDFGLYRLFRLKRSEIEAFLDKQLPAEVEKEFASMADAKRESWRKELEELAKSVRKTINDDAILPSGEPNPAYAGNNIVKEYAEARKRLEAVEASEAQRAEVYNLLYSFFSRYYDKGDFIPRRFFGARPAYAVPYNGEEVFFHWANKDQYYVKSGEAFRDYAFTLPTVSGEYRVHFRLAEATTPKDNTKGDTRYFFPKPEDVVSDDKACTIIIPFEYRLPTEGEAAKYGKNSKGQEAILDETAPKIIKAVKDNILGSVLAAPSPTGRKAEGEQPPSLLRRRLSHFTKKNTTDYFVHKNLSGFLRQELEFFIRDQVVHELDLEGDFEAKRRMLRVFRKVADTVITFLAQIEDAQKRLFEKKKFVLRTDYLIPIQNIPSDLWQEVLANKAQLDEWETLYALAPKSDLFNFKGQVNEHVLEQNPTLVVDTLHFSPDPSTSSGQSFTAGLLESIEDIDEQTDCLLIHGENFHALNLMVEKYREKVKCIYIDPPYNTGNDGFVYKDAFQHSTWLAMMIDRLRLARESLSTDSVIFVSNDENEYSRLRMLLTVVFGSQFVENIIWRKKSGGGQTDEYFVTEHDYILCYAKEKGAFKIREKTLEKSKEGYPIYDKKQGKYYRLVKFAKWGTGAHKEDRPTMYFPLKDPDGNDNYPIAPDGRPGRWRYGKPKVLEIMENDGIEWVKKDVTWIPYEKDYEPEEGERSILKERSIFYDLIENTAGSNELKALFGIKDVFPNPKPSDLIYHLSMLSTNDSDYVLDFFAGSGTTGHAVINLNREDGGRRKFILVEMADYFDSVLVPRIKKVMFTPEWKDGKPKRLASKEEAERTPRLVKVLRLESYEDALHNTFSDKAIERLAVREEAYRKVVGDDEYRVRYLVKLPLEASDSMLNLAKLEHPFDYTLEVLTDYGPKTETVDLLETFNWLYGLRVRRMLTWTNPKDKSGKEKSGRMYRAVVGSDREDKKRVLVVWRDMTGLDPVIDRVFLESKAKEFGLFEEQWVNCDSAAKGFASLDGLFKRLMKGGEA